MKEFRLCYVSSPWAYFTNQDLGKQWGDDWDDAPYEHNAGEPYGPHGADEHHEILRVAFDAPMETPGDKACSGNSRYSVQDINAGAVAWLHSSKPSVAIMAGVTIDEFKAAINKAGGSVYERTL